MPRLPDKNDLSQRDVRPQYSIPEFRTNPIPGAIQQFGNALGDLGGVLSQKQRDEARFAEGESRKATAEREQAEKYGYASKLLQFEQQQHDYLKQKSESVEPGAANFSGSFETDYDTRAKEFFSSVPEHLRGEYDVKLLDMRQRFKTGATKFEGEEGRRFTGNQIDGNLNTLLDRQRQNPAGWGDVQKEGDALIDAAPHFSTIEKDEKKKAWREQRVSAWVKENPMEAEKLIKAPVSKTAPVGGIASGISATAKSLGIDPVDLATAISYETAGTFDPTKAGPRTQWGQHKGLIQFGEPQAKKYGVDWNNATGSQLGPDGAIAKYLKDAGVKPGMGLLDIYSAINAGGVGKYNASDANNGGAPGTVADKVKNQMASHRANAIKLMGGAAKDQIQTGATTDVVDTTTTTTTTAAAGAGGGGVQYASIAPELEGLPHDKLMSVMGTAQEAAQKQQIAMATARKEELDLGIETGVVTSADDILNDPSIDNGDKATLLRRFNERQETGMTAAQVRSDLVAGNYLDTTDGDVKKGLNRIFSDAGGAQKLIEGDQTAVSTAMFMWQKGNVIADDAKQAVQSMIRSPDDETMVKGYAYLDQFQRMNPQAFDAVFPEGVAKQLQGYTNLVGYVSPEQMAAEMRKRSDPEWQRTREPLRKVGEKKAAENFDAAAVVSLFDERGSLNYFSSAPDAPKVAGDSEVMAGDFRKFFADAYAETGDDELAKANALKMLKRVWSPSVMNGGAITAYAPDKYYPTIDGAHDWMVELLEQDLKDAGYVSATNVRTNPRQRQADVVESARSYSLRAIPLTQAQIAGGRLPQYHVIVINPETGLPDVVMNDKGVAQLWPSDGDVKAAMDKRKAEFDTENAAQTDLNYQTDAASGAAEAEPWLGQ